MKKLGRSPEVLLDGFSTALPSGEVLYSDHWLKAVPIYIDGRELFADLVILEMQDYDVILGMDWLSKYNATIDCKKKMVVFQPSEEDQFMFVSTPSKTRMPMISIMKAEKLLKKGCIITSSIFGRLL